jgi:hypothetical protein
VLAIAEKRIFFERLPTGIVEGWPGGRNAGPDSVVDNDDGTPCPVRFAYGDG